MFTPFSTENHFFPTYSPCIYLPRLTMAMSSFLSTLLPSESSGCQRTSLDLSSHEQRSCCPQQYPRCVAGLCTEEQGKELTTVAVTHLPHHLQELSEHLFLAFMPHHVGHGHYHNQSIVYSDSVTFGATQSECQSSLDPCCAHNNTHTQDDTSTRSYCYSCKTWYRDEDGHDCD